MKTTLLSNNYNFRPLGLVNLNLTKPPTILNFKVIERMYYIDLTFKVIYHYLKLTNGKFELILPVKFYDFIVAGYLDDENVEIKYSRLSNNSGTYNFIEIEKYPQVDLDIVNNVQNPYQTLDNKIPKCYTYQHQEEVNSSLIYGTITGAIVTQYSSVYIKDNIFVNAICYNTEVNKMLKPAVYYRSLYVNKELFYTDMEVKFQ